MITIRNADFKPVRTSRNLRGILDYTRAHGVQRVDVWPGKSGGAQLGVTWLDGASCMADFASFTVCKEWCAARRAFPTATIHGGAK